MVEILKRHREAAAAYFRSIADPLRAVIAERGDYDLSQAVQAFAKFEADHLAQHRQPGQSGGEVERDAQVLSAAIDQNDAMRQELANIGNLVSDLARALGVDQANTDGTWPNLSGRVQRLIEHARASTPSTERERRLEEALRKIERISSVILNENAEAQVADLTRKLEMAEKALEPFALIADEGVARHQKGYASITTCAEYFHRASSALAAIRETVRD